MSKLDGHWLTRLAWAATFVLVAVILAPATWAQAGPSKSSQSRRRMAQAVEKTLQDGLQAKLPPHISTLLGLTKEEECPVMQGVVRSGKRVQGFDVSTLNRTDVVIFVVDQATNDQTLYLTSTTGTLRRVVRVEKGDGRAQKITDEDRTAFEKEKHFWLDQLAPTAVP